MKTTLRYRREVADKLISYLKEHDIKTCTNTYEMLKVISEAINEPLFMLWRAYYLLRIMARIEMNSPNGKCGFHVLDYNPLAIALPDRPNLLVCEAQSCPILKMIQRKWKDFSLAPSAGKEGEVE